MLGLTSRNFRGSLEDLIFKPHSPIDKDLPAHTRLLCGFGALSADPKCWIKINLLSSFDGASLVYSNLTC